uniref:ATP synthase F0 subunit 6 n=1 Tax=Astroscopus sexspinosus TaxID=3127373 RepID=UPI0030FE6246
MTVSLFDQFSSPLLLGVPLIALALTLPWLLFPAASTRWVNNRLSNIQNWFLNNFVQQLLLPISMKGHKWALLLASLMLYLITLNSLGLLPYTYTPTTQLSLNLGLAGPLWFTTILLGARNRPSTSLAHLLPEGTPIPLIPVLIIIETISLLIRPLALGVRLTANLTAGHLLIQLIASSAITLLPTLMPIGAVTFLLLLSLNVLEVAVAIIQAYVFVLLLTLYLEENT